MAAKKIKAKADFLFEVSWEVCNRVGGIYRVLESKAKRVVDYYGKNYFLLGPYFPEKARGEFQEKTPPKLFKKTFEDLEREGLHCHFGKWLVEGEPRVVLIDFTNFWVQANKIKRELWESYGIDSLSSGYDFAEPVVWSWAVGKLIEKLSKPLKGKKIVIHCHEWLAGTTLLYLKQKGVKAGTVFTTHATILGRSLANNNLPLYALLGKIDPQKEAYHYQIQAKYQLEKAAAKNCDVFTTISKITSLEAENFLERKPDFLLPNGLEIEKLPDFEEIFFQQRIQQNRLREFCLYYFSPYYRINLRNALFYFIVGRYEFHNKGIDLFIQALGKLNKKLKAKKARKTVVAFFWIPAGNQGIREEVFQARENYQDIKDYLEEFFDSLKENILSLLVMGKKFQKKTLFANERDFFKEIKKKRLKLQRKGLPPLSTHYLSDPNDIILRSFRENGLENKKEDRVKVVFLPIYLTGSDGLLNLNYYESIQASHLGVFPSFYEPWGYTALETSALGVSSITTDLSGFGRFSKKFSQKRKNPGIFVLERFGKSDEDFASELSEALYRFSQLSRKERIENKIRARKRAEVFDWKILIKKYIKAHNQALKF